MNHSVQGGLRTILRLEGLAVLFAAVALYRHFDGGWGLFAALFFVPDLAFAAYLAGSRLGTIGYNCTHTYLGPIGLAAFGAFAHQSLSTPIAIIWIAHIGFDRALGYGLKYASSFDDTHLGRIGKRPSAEV
jgi:hypothetical protein